MIGVPSGTIKQPILQCGNLEVMTLGGNRGHLMNIDDPRWGIVRDEENRVLSERITAMGIPIKSVYDLLKDNLRRKDVVEYLLSSLRWVTNDRIREGVYRALAVRNPELDYCGELIHHFMNEPCDTPSQKHVKWAIGLAVAECATDKDIEPILQVLRDPSHGFTRSEFCNTFEQMKSESSRKAGADELIRQLNDPEIGQFAMIALGDLRDLRLEQHVGRFLSHPNAWIREKARAAQRKLETAKRRGRV